MILVPYFIQPNISKHSIISTGSQYENVNELFHLSLHIAIFEIQDADYT